MGQQHVAEPALHLGPGVAIDPEDVVHRNVLDSGEASLQRRLQPELRDDLHRVLDPRRGHERRRPHVVPRSHLGLVGGDGSFELHASRHVGDQRAEDGVPEARGRIASARPDEHAALFRRQGEVALLRLLEGDESSLVLLAAVQVVRVDEVQHGLDGPRVELVQTTPEDRHRGAEVADGLADRRAAQLPRNLPRVEVVPGVGHQTDRVQRAGGLHAEARLVHGHAEEPDDGRGAHLVAELRGHDVVRFRGALRCLVPDRADLVVGRDRHDVADSADEAPAARTVVLGPHLEGGVGPFGEGAEVLLVERVSRRAGRKDVRVAGDLLKCSGDDRRECGEVANHWDLVGVGRSGTRLSSPSFRRRAEPCSCTAHMWHRPDLP